jgi:hypothetical protein
LLLNSNIFFQIITIALNEIFQRPVCRPMSWIVLD